ncbi:ATP-binding protein [Plantactinospora solaniradicis]|uniref:ATP-binding protein n=1 Tax=Plantactinospora solaniradicis TaxID=1723736 RepID=A0ABW1K9I5_9ACTN
METAGSPASGGPDPLRAESVRAFVAGLGLLKVWAGNPSFERLARLSGIPRSTLADALNERRSRLPALDVVRGFVRACGVVGDGVGGWEDAWRRLQQAATADAAEPGPVATPPATVRPVPAMLPADSSDVVGRDKQVAQLTDLLTPVSGGEGTAPLVVAAVSGRPGVGKTTLAVRVAHRLVDAFPDGQLYVNLHTADAEPVDPALVLGRFLRMLGLEGSAVPAGLEERAELYRSVLAGRRVLVVLDNADSAAQVRPLLPGTPASAVLLTSRSRLHELSGTRRLDLDVLEPDDALELLAAVVGVERVAAEPDAAREIARLCGCLPLAVRIAAARLATRPHHPLARLADRLSDRQRRLNELAVGDLDVRASLALSYHALEASAARALRLLAALDAPEFAAWVAAPLLDIEVDEAEELVDILAEAYLIDATGTDPAGRVRYRLHDLVRLYARERGEVEDEEGQRRAALARAFGAWLAIAESVDDRLPSRECPPIRGDAPRYRLPAGQLAHLLADPLTWIDGERANLVAAVEQACALGLPEYAWNLAGASVNFFDLRGHYDDGHRVCQLALDQSRRTGNRLGEAVMLLGLTMLWNNGREVDQDRCMAAAVRAVELFGQLAEPLGEAKALDAVAYSHFKYGRLDEALRCVERALSIGASGHPDLEVSLWLTRGFVHSNRGDRAESETSYARALDLSRGSGLRIKEALTLRALGSLHLRHADHQQAESCLWRAMTIMTELEHVSAQAAILLTIGQLQAHQRHPDAAATLERALTSCRLIGVAFGQALALSELATLHTAGGRPRSAIDACSEALDLARGLGQPHLRAMILQPLGAAHRALGDRRAAAVAWREARDLRAGLGNAVEVAQLDALLVECDDE